MVDDHVVDAPVVELLPMGLAAAREADVAGDQALLVLGGELLTVARLPTGCPSGLEGGGGRRHGASSAERVRPSGPRFLLSVRNVKRPA
jgi:hypothetical protein